jgi:hypothetical protein
MPMFSWFRSRSHRELHDGRLPRSRSIAVVIGVAVALGGCGSSSSASPDVDASADSSDDSAATHDAAEETACTLSTNVRETVCRSKFRLEGRANELS